MNLSHIPKLYRPSKGYNGASNTSPPRNPERLARRIERGNNTIHEKADPFPSDYSGPDYCIGCALDWPCPEAENGR